MILQMGETRRHVSHFVPLIPEPVCAGATPAAGTGSADARTKTNRYAFATGQAENYRRMTSINPLLHPVSEVLPLTESEAYSTQVTSSFHESQQQSRAI